MLDEFLVLGLSGTVNFATHSYLQNYIHERFFRCSFLLHLPQCPQSMKSLLFIARQYPCQIFV